MRSIVNQQTIDYGYDTGGIMSARMGLMDGDYPTPAARKLFFDRLLTTLRSSSQFESVALTSRFQMVFSGNGPIEIEGKTYAAKGDHPNVNFEQVSPGFFNVLGQKMLEGRDFDDADLDSKAPVAVVNAAVRAKALRKRERASAGGSAPATEARPSSDPWRTIVGVVTTVRMSGPVQQPQRGRQRLLRALLFGALRPRGPGTAREPVRHRHREAARGPERGGDSSRSAA